jgi:hypothetical protein
LRIALSFAKLAFCCTVATDTWLRHINFCAPIGKGNNIIEAQKCISNELAHQKNRMIYANHLFNLLGPDVWFDTCKLIKIMLNHA